MKIRQGFVLLFSTFCLVPSVFADMFSDLSFTPDAADLSINYLGMVFGNVGSALSTANPNDLIAQIFRVFNIGVLVMTMSIISYTVFTTVVGVSQEGSGAFQTKISPWVTFRIVAGSSLLLPSFGGYSGIQILVMTAVVKGVGFANALWATTVDHVSLSGQSVISSRLSQASSGGTTTSFSASIASSQLRVLTDQFASAFKAGICAGAYAHTDTEAGQNEENNPNYGMVQKSGTSLSIIGRPAESGRPAVSCGTVAIPSGLSGNADFVNQMQNSIQNIVVQGKKYFYKFVSKNLSNGCVETDEDAAKSNSACSMAAADIVTQAVSYGSLVASAQVSSSSQNSQEDWAVEAKRRGWITAAMYYNKLLAPGAKTVSTKCRLGVSGDTCGNLFSGLTISNNLPNDLSTGTQSYFKKAAGGAYGTGVTKDTAYAYIDNAKDLASSYFVTPTSTGSQSSNPTGSDAQYYLIMETLRNNIAAGIDSGLKMDAWPVSTSLTGLDGDPYFAFHHMLVLTNTVISKMTGCVAYNCEGGGNYDKMGCTKLERNDASLCRQKQWSTYERSTDTSQRTGFLKMLADEKLGKAINPLAEMRELGITMMKASVNYWQTTLHTMYSKSVALAWKGFGIKTGINALASTAMIFGYANVLAAALIGAAQATAIGLVDMFLQFTKLAMEVYVPFGTALATVFFGLGVVLGIYLPFMPYLLYVFGAIGWLIGVAESMVAAPLVAMGITHPEGHDLLGKAEQSMMLLLGIFIRPATMLIGFIFAINLASIAVALLNRGFMSVLADSLASITGTALVTTIGVVGTMLVYTYVMMAVLDQAYSLIYQIPDRILRWIGGPADAPGAGAAQAAREVKSQTQSAGQQAGQGAGQAMSAPNIQSDSSSGSFDGKGIGEDRAEQNKGGGSASQGG